MNVQVHFYTGDDFLKHFRGDRVFLHQTAHFRGNWRFVRPGSAQPLPPFAQPAPLFLDAQIDIVGNVVDHAAECVKASDIATAFTAQRDKRKREIRFAGSGYLGCVHC